MFIEKWTIIILIFLLIYLIYKINEHTKKINGLQHDLNDLEVQVGVLEGEEWAINSEINKQRKQKEKREHYDGKTSDGEYDGLLGKDRRKRDGENPKLVTKIK